MAKFSFASARRGDGSYKTSGGNGFDKARVVVPDVAEKGADRPADHTWMGRV
jgi:hypothetical protein